jgi:hypothetical protein
MENYNQTDTEQNINNTTQIDRGTDRDYDGEFIYRSIIFSLMVLVIFISILCCHRERISKCFEHYLTTNGTSSDSEYANRVWRQHMENEAKKIEPPEKRRARIWESIERNAVFMIIQKSCFYLRDGMNSCSSRMLSTEENQENRDADNIKNTDNESHISTSSYQDEDLEIQLLHGSKNGSRRVPNGCAICLSGYDEGDKIVWSSNEECKHAFHDDCILIWLVKNQNGTPCPCCRCEFTDLYPFHNDENGNTRNRTNLFPLASTLRVRYSSRRDQT